MERHEFEEHLINDLIPFWKDLKDEQYGGFYGHMDKDLKVDKHADKGVILNSRILWFFSASYSLLKDEDLLIPARHAYEFLRKYCYDKSRGGVYWALTYDGKPVDTTKHTYNQAFAIYALSEYYMASSDADSLVLAYELFDLVEHRCRDKDGYLEAFSVDFTPDDNNEKLSENGVIAERTMNTLLHVLEAYSNLYKADNSQEVADRLKEIADIFSEKVFDTKRGRLKVFFDLDYNSLIDLYSYGHDIEASWLLDRAAEVLDDPEYTRKIHLISDVLADEVHRHAYSKSERALYNECENGTDDRKKVWWVQAESVVGFRNAFEKHPDRTDYEEASEEIFSFILDKMIDLRCGEWYENILEDGTKDLGRGIVHQWKCPYHNGRMCIEMCRRLKS